MATFLSNVEVLQRRMEFGPHKGELRWFVCKNKIPMDAMYDFFDAGKLRVPYPFRRMGTGEPHSPGGQLDGYATEAEAQEKFIQLKQHVALVLKLPKNEKPGSSRAWT